MTTTDNTPPSEQEEEEIVAEPALTDSTTDEEAAPAGEPVEEAKPAETDSYFDDDEDFIKAADEPIHEAADLAMFLQSENVISWKIINFFQDNGKPRSKRALRNDPPILRISDNKGEQVDFIVTVNFARSMGALMENVHRSYFGVQPKEDPTQAVTKSFRSRMLALKAWALAHKVRAGALLLLSLAIIVTLIKTSIGF